MTGRLSKFWRPSDLRLFTRYSRADDRTASGTVVPQWPATIAHPVMALTSTATKEAVMEALGAGLDSAGFTVNRTTEGFRATRVSWFDVVTFQSWERTIVSARLTTSERLSPVEVTLRVESGGSHSAAMYRCVDGLNDAIGQLRSKGFDASVTDWHSTEHG